MELHFPEDCTVRRACEIRNLLLSSLGDDTVLSFEKIEEADLSFFQLLHSAEATSRKWGKKLVMVPNLAAKLAPKAAMTGFGHIVEGCVSVQ